MPTREQINEAWNRGYDAEPNARCPYEMGDLWGAWMGGVVAASEDRVAGRLPRWWMQNVEAAA